ncbi:hypothetical protein FPANT_12040 [Fusarium pseudoanthophilum]|uniref:Uncharacterized protein n=1 Tax=Fusarium pseudoanthophilum TaxID=48495 RepID=A0A8H5KJN8_9HYPO|nr:hypothetical protein FPANT_12040 [Fusarium pseudoanthophilum]
MAVLSTFLYSLGSWLTTTGETEGNDMPAIEGTLRKFNDAWERWSEWSPEAQKGKGLARSGVPEVGLEHGDGADE